MTIIALLAVLALVQGVFLALLATFLFINRGRRDRARRRRDAATGILREPVHRWMIGTGSADQVAALLAALPPGLALQQLGALAGTRASAGQMAELVAAIEGDPWIDTLLQQCDSRFWWKRLEAARLLGIVGTPRHRDALRRLLDDPHPAVQVAATTALPRTADLDAVSLALDRLPARGAVVRLYQFGVLRATHLFTVPALLERLHADAPAAHLEVWIGLAEAIGEPALVARVITLASHPEAMVRVAVARALRGWFHPDAARVLRELLDDPDWRVRAQAARGLGNLADMASAEPLARALTDPSWWVRFRAGLALAQLGERGRALLRDTRAGSDRYAAEMAALVSGLSRGSVVELSEG
ncbi:MAG TPA: HEAT repeat domain-containing protein [Gemmatimonadaceae bacterium]